MTGQAQLAITESDVVLFLVGRPRRFNAPGSENRSEPARIGKKTYLVVNKAEGLTETAKGRIL